MPRDPCTRKVLPREIPTGHHGTFYIPARCFALSYTFSPCWLFFFLDKGEGDVVLTREFADTTPERRSRYHLWKISRKLRSHTYTSETYMFPGLPYRSCRGITSYILGSSMPVATDFLHPARISPSHSLPSCEMSRAHIKGECVRAFGSFSEQSLLPSCKWMSQIPAMFPHMPWTNVMFLAASPWRSVHKRLVV